MATAPRANSCRPHSQAGTSGSRAAVGERAQARKHAGGAPACGGTDAAASAAAKSQTERGLAGLHPVLWHAGLHGAFHQRAA